MTVTCRVSIARDDTLVAPCDGADDATGWSTTVDMLAARVNAEDLRPSARARLLWTTGRARRNERLVAIDDRTLP